MGPNTKVKPNCLNIWHSRTSCINTFLTFWHTSAAAAVSYSTTKYILHTEAWRAFLSHYFKYAVPVNCLSNTGMYSSTEEQVNVCCLSRKKAKRRHKNGPAEHRRVYLWHTRPIWVHLLIGTQRGNERQVLVALWQIFRAMLGVTCDAKTFALKVFLKEVG